MIMGFFRSLDGKSVLVGVLLVVVAAKFIGPRVPAVAGIVDKLT